MVECLVDASPVEMGRAKARIARDSRDRSMRPGELGERTFLLAAWKPDIHFAPPILVHFGTDLGFPTITTSNRLPLCGAKPCGDIRRTLEPGFGVSGRSLDSAIYLRRRSPILCQLLFDRL